MGKKRVDELVAIFEKELPQKSKSFEELYSKVWKPEDYPYVEAP